jgi:hypothetical protein
MMSVLSIDGLKPLQNGPGGKDEEDGEKEEEQDKKVPPTSSFLSTSNDVEEDDWCQFADVTETVSEEEDECENTTTRNVAINIIQNKDQGMQLQGQDEMGDSGRPSFSPYRMMTSRPPPPVDCTRSLSSTQAAFHSSPGLCIRDSSWLSSSSSSAAAAAPTTLHHLAHNNSSHTSSSSSPPPPSSFRLEMLPQLHPAVSLGVRRVSSCYLSIYSEESVADMLSQLGEHQQQQQQHSTTMTTTTTISNECSEVDRHYHPNNSDHRRRSNSIGSSGRHTTTINKSEDDGGGTACDCSPKSDPSRTSLVPSKGPTAKNFGPHQIIPSLYLEQSTSDLLYHDILMDVFTFLDAPSLAAFSESARRPNFEVFYFLQLQLQQALLLDDEKDDDDGNDNDEDGSIGSFASDLPGGDGNSITSNLVGSISAGERNGGDHDIDIEEIAVRQRRQPRNDCQDRSTIAGCASLSRLAGMNLSHAQGLVQEYLESNSTLRTMPLSHSIAYARHFLQRHGFSKMFPATNSRTTSAQTLASAAIFMTVVGAASIVSSVGGADAATSMANLTDSFGSELPNVLFRVGFVGSLMGAASRISDTEQRAAIREQAEQMARSAEQMARSMQERMMMRGNHNRVDDDDNNDTTTTGTNQQPRQEQSFQSSSVMPTNFRLPSLFQMRVMLQETMFAARQHHDRQTVLSDPYDHLPRHHEGDGDRGDYYEKEGEEKKVESIVATDLPRTVPTTRTVAHQSTVDRKMPSGCVGAYSRAVHKANIQIATSVRASRKSKFDSMPMEDRQRHSLEFLNACTSNESLDRVKEMIVSMDVDGFFVGNDGSETCALHTASFHGAEKVVDFLCVGIDDQDPHNDGGLCQVNLQDDNGWTALHFAAGANSVSVLHVLVRHGATLKVVAHNGYTPLQWAVRLSNQAVADELSKILSTTRSGPNRGGGVWMSSQPLTSIANRFFSLIPTH